MGLAVSFWSICVCLWSYPVFSIIFYLSWFCGFVVFLCGVLPITVFSLLPWLSCSFFFARFFDLLFFCFCSCCFCFLFGVCYLCFCFPFFLLQYLSPVSDSRPSLFRCCSSECCLVIAFCVFRFALLHFFNVGC